MIRITDDERLADQSPDQRQVAADFTADDGIPTSSKANPSEGSSASSTVEILAATSALVPTGSADANNVSGQSEWVEPVTWQTAMKRAIRSSLQLRRRLGLPEQTSPQSETDFPTFVPLEYLGRIRPGDPNDPLLRQVLPVASEDEIDHPGYSADPVGDMGALVAGGLLHKYHGRTLVVTTGACGVHCRYCFRRQFPYSDAGSQQESYLPAIKHLIADTSIDEVILSGGDPLTLADAKLDALIAQLEAIPHLRRLRFHTRMPVVIPQRVTDALVERLRKSRLTTWFVIHVNHANEIDDAVIAATSKLIDAGIPVLNQAVLLAGVNDDIDTLADLCLRLVNHRITPYYLHQLDRVTGAAHFEVPTETGLRLVAELTKRLPGYAVPTYVAERAGEASKTRLP